MIGVAGQSKPRLLSRSSRPAAAAFRIDQDARRAEMSKSETFCDIPTDTEKVCLSGRTGSDRPPFETAILTLSGQLRERLDIDQDENCLSGSPYAVASSRAERAIYFAGTSAGRRRQASQIDSVQINSVSGDHPMMRCRHARVQQLQWSRPARHRHAEGRRPGGCHEEDGTHAADDPAVGRELRHRF